jgi:hypothetical protein
MKKQKIKLMPNFERISISVMLIGLSFSVAPHIVHAQASEETLQLPQNCADYVGNVTSPKTFEQALSSIKIYPPKGEFETKSAYEQRISDSGNQKEIVLSVPIQRDGIKYDAENQKFEIFPYAFLEFSNSKLKPQKFFIEIKKYDVAGTSNLYFMYSSVEKLLGSYQAQNSFGAQAKITKITYFEKAVFDRKTNLFERLFYNNIGLTKIGEISVPIQSALEYKAKLTAAFVVVPKAPYIERGAYQDSAPTISNPYDVEVNATILMADIRCALIMDSGYKVIAAYETR